MKRSDWYVLKIVLGGVGVAIVALVINESQTLSQMALRAMGNDAPQGPVVQIIERPVEIAKNEEPGKPSSASAPGTPAANATSVAANTPALASPAVVDNTEMTVPVSPPVAAAPVAAASSMSTPVLSSVDPVMQKAPLPPNKNRVAFIVGNNEYQNVPKLRNAVTDATAIANMLKSLGYTVTLVTNSSSKQFAKAFDAWLSKIDRKSESVFFFAGHGVQVEGKNFLLATDAVFDSEAGLPDDIPSLQGMMERWASRGPKFSIAIVDACRDNPFPVRTRSLTAAQTRSIEPTSAGSGQIILYSAGSGQTALDNLGPGDPIVNSVFTRSLLKYMPSQTYSVDEVLRKTRLEVIEMARKAGHDQTPALYDESTGEFYFNPQRAGT